MCFYSSIALVVTEWEAGTECWRRWGRGGIIAGDSGLANTIFHHLVQIESLAILTRLQRVLKMCLKLILSCIKPYLISITCECVS